MNRSTDDIYDELLAIRCKRNDVDAWDELVRRYNDQLFYFVRRLVDDDDVAAQLLQDAWLQALRGMDSLRQAGRVAPWLYTIARRTVMTHYRRHYAHPEITNAETLDSPANPETDTDIAFDNIELVHYGLGRIGRAEREVLTLFFLDDLSIAEIAGVLEIPPGTVKSRLSRARGELRQVLEREAASQSVEGETS